MAKRPASESIDWLAQAIKRLPSDDPVPVGTPGYNRYNTQKDHWLGWLNPNAGTGTYPRQTGTNRDALDVYNRIVEPKLLVWLISAAGVQTERVHLAVREAESVSKLSSKSAAIRRCVPWHVVAEALRRGERNVRSNNALQWTSDHRGRPVLAMNGVLAGAEWASCPAAELNR